MRAYIFLLFPILGRKHTILFLEKLGELLRWHAHTICHLAHRQASLSNQRQAMTSPRYASTCVVEDSFHNLLSPLHFHCYPFLGWHILVRGTDLQQELRQVTRSRLQFLHTIIQPAEAYQLIHVIEQRLGISVYHLQLFLSPRESLISHQLFNGRYKQRRLEWLCAIDSIYRLATAHRYRLQGFERRYQEWADHQGLPSNSAQRQRKTPATSYLSWEENGGSIF